MFHGWQPIFYGWQTFGTRELFHVPDDASVAA
jgi:hypothetical protein